MASIPVGSIANWAAVPTCTTNCPATLGEAKAQGFLRPGATLAQLLGVDADGSLGNLGNLILNDILLGILPRSSLNWEQFARRPPALRRHRRERPLPRARERACSGASGFSINVLLPKGFIVKPQTSFVTYGIGDRRAAPNPTTNATTGARWASFRRLVPARGSPRARRRSSSTSRPSSGTSRTPRPRWRPPDSAARRLQDSDQIARTQNWERNEDPATAPVMGPDALQVELSTSPLRRRQGGLPAADPVGAGYADDGLPESHTAGRRLRPRHQPAWGAVADPEPRRLDPGRLDPHRGRRCWSTTARITPETLQDIPVGSILVGSISATRGTSPRSHGRLRRSERLLHDPGPRLQRLAQRGARRPARRADAAADAAPVSGQDLPEQGRPQRTLPPRRCPPRRRPSSSTTEAS